MSLSPRESSAALNRFNPSGVASPLPLRNKGSDGQTPASIRQNALLAGTSSAGRSSRSFHIARDKNVLVPPKMTLGPAKREAHLAP